MSVILTVGDLKEHLARFENDTLLIEMSSHAGITSYSPGVSISNELTRFGDKKTGWGMFPSPDGDIEGLVL
jgi:hypothetical protein